MKTYIPGTIEAITEHLECLSNAELVQAHNQYCKNRNYHDDEIFENDEDFFESNFNDNIMSAVRAVSYGVYSISHKWVKFNGNGNLISFNDPSDEIEIPEIAEDVLENAHDYSIELEDVEEETED